MSFINFSSDPETVYPVFEPDQVLTNKHLNAAIAHLQQQESLTRTLILGTGIITGLQAKYDSAAKRIIITPGVGITGSGYLINFKGGVYSASRTYTLPALPETIEESVKTFYTALNPDELVPLENMVEDDIPFTTTTENTLKDKVVMLLAEPRMDRLKNCTTDDCADKGQEVNITYRPLLVDATKLTALHTFVPSQYPALFPEIPLRRWNVPADSIQHPSALVASYERVLNAQLTADMNQAFSFVYNNFHHLFTVANDKDIATVGTKLATQMAIIRNEKPYYMQCVYAFAKDLIKAYEEFCAVAVDLFPAPAANKPAFPLHLCLGTTVRESDNTNSYRHQFDEPPLVRTGDHRFGEACLLYKRIVLMINTFQLPETAKTIMVTPSRTSVAPLGTQAIPYYYNSQLLTNCWDYTKLIAGRTKSIRGYNTAVTLPNALAWEFEDPQVDFFRIEGHLGQNVLEAMKRINSLKIRNQLSFDAVAINLYATSTTPTRAGLLASFADLENQYQLVVTELLNRVTPLVKGLQQVSIDIESIKRILGSYNEASPNGYILTPYVEVPGTNIGAEFMTQIDMRPYYQRGAYLQYFFGTKFSDTTIGGYYLRWADLPANSTALVSLPPVYNFTDTEATWRYNHAAHACYLMDRLEELLRMIVPYNLDKLDLARFNQHVKKFTDALGSYAAFYNAWQHALDVIRDGGETNNTILVEEQEYWNRVASLTIPMVAACKSLEQLALDERMGTLKREYEKRCAFVLNQLIFTNFTREFPGMRHQSGVVAGGTLVLVYFDRTDVEGAPNYPMDSVNQRIVQGTVCADFYLPNKLVTSYAPLAKIYETTPETEVEPRISLDSHLFCNGQSSQNQITIWPETGGEVGGPGITSETVGTVKKWYFNPAAVTPGDYNLTHKVGNRIAYFAINVKMPVNADFTVPGKTTNVARNGVDVVFQAADVRGTHTWIFGDGTSATGPAVSHLYTMAAGATREYTVQHIVNDGSICVDPAVTKTVIVKRDDLPLTLSVEEFNPCTNLNQVRIYNSPTGGTVSCPATGAISNVGGVFYFNPSAAGNGKHIITYTFNGRSITCEVTVKQALSAAFTYTLELISSTPAGSSYSGGGATSLVPNSSIVNGPGGPVEYEYRTYEVKCSSTVTGAHEWFLSTGEAAVGSSAALRFGGKFPVNAAIPDESGFGIVANPVPYSIPVDITHRITAENQCKTTKSIFLMNIPSGELTM
ncbi:PKD domain-containing protein [Chitinophaga sp. sic0106]|uniref:PKD domain-containing protein n=1 Tax=Chitinophaga sp. sic0106 TaxID=2854785 RepID=UPI001C480704|nr:PKD domain-containing protein [Chitinophaga sp. sic0106]MBV7530223.1 PKD domain-containing protein [Chitinophaga sp. sic0106]